MKTEHPIGMRVVDALWPEPFNGEPVECTAWGKKSREGLAASIEELTAVRDLLEACRKLDHRPEHGGTIPWVHNAGITNNIEALRTICLAYADAWNEYISPAIAKATGGST